MHLPTALRRAMPIAIVALAMAAPTLAFSPTVTVVTTESGDKVRATDLASRNGNLAISLDAELSGIHRTALSWSVDEGATWDTDLLSDHRARESQASWCAGQARIVYSTADGSPADEWLLWVAGHEPVSTIESYRRWTSSGVARKPDIACIANEHIAVAWFQKQSSGHKVRLKVMGTNGDDPYSQSFDLGGGSMGRGLAVAASATRLYVTWFDGDTLKLRRFSIGSGSNHTLSALGTTTIADLPHADTPRIGADGDRVVVAYMHRADLKVRRSTNKGVSFGSAKTLADKPYPSEAGALPTTVAVKGSKVVIGSVEFSESSGKGVGYLSTNGGSSYTKQPSHAGGRLVAGMVKVGDASKYAEAWDESFSDPGVHHVEFLHK